MVKTNWMGVNLDYFSLTQGKSRLAQFDPGGKTGLAVIKVTKLDKNACKHYLIQILRG